MSFVVYVVETTLVSGLTPGTLTAIRFILTVTGSDESN